MGYTHKTNRDPDSKIENANRASGGQTYLTGFTSRMRQVTPFLSETRR